MLFEVYMRKDRIFLFLLSGSHGGGGGNEHLLPSVSWTGLKRPLGWQAGTAHAGEERNPLRERSQWPLTISAWRNICGSARFEIWTLCQTDSASLGLKHSVDYVTVLLWHFPRLPTVNRIKSNPSVWHFSLPAGGAQSTSLTSSHLLQPGPLGSFLFTCTSSLP